MPRVCDYETKDYYTDFWSSGERAYEDAAERIALSSLLPSSGRWVLELGAGFGRLADIYLARFEQVVLLDYSRNLLRQARERFGDRPGLHLVVGDIYNLPFADSLFNAATMVRVLHHIERAPAAFAEVHRVLRGNGTYVLEYANKRNAKEIARFLLGRSARRPFSHEPATLDDLYFNFHPAYVRQRLDEVGFNVVAERAVSLFRLPFLKRRIGARTLAALDGTLQGPLGHLQISPSVFVSSQVLKTAAPPVDGRLKLRCPACGGLSFDAGRETLSCQGCGRVWSTADGIYDFREPIG